MSFLTGTEDYPAGAEKLLAAYPDIRLLDLTMGADGSMAFCGKHRVFEDSFHLGGVIETSGAGDTFCALVLHYVLEHGLDLDEAQLHEMLRTANGAAYLVTTKKGVIPSLPDAERIEKLLRENR